LDCTIRLRKKHSIHVTIDAERRKHSNLTYITTFDSHFSDERSLLKPPWMHIPVSNGIPYKPWLSRHSGLRGRDYHLYKYIKCIECIALLM
jgi:hypothetical protein